MHVSLQPHIIMEMDYIFNVKWGMEIENKKILLFYFLKD